MVHRHVSHFEILEPLGDGAFGIVYRSRDLTVGRYGKLERVVALKFLRPHLVNSAEARKSLRREAVAISVLDHPNIETLHELCEEDDEVFLVLQYLPGGSLRSRINELRSRGIAFSVREAVRCGLQIAEGLAYAHSRDIVHLDIKPSNVLFSGDNRPVLTDFGLARLLNTDATATKEHGGTIPYMSPERFRNGGRDVRMDIYSLGVLLYEMTTGELPYDGPDVPAQVESILRDPVPSLLRLRRDAPVELERLVRRAMAKDPIGRYQRAADIVRDLRQIDEGTPVPAVKDEFSETRTVALGARAWVPGWALLAAPTVLAAAVSLSFAVWPWPYRCLMAPGLFAACELPSTRHVGVLPFENLADDDPDRALFGGLEHIVTAKLAQLGQHEAKLCVHKLRDRTEVTGLNLVLRGTTERAGGRIRVTASLSRPHQRLHLRRLELEAGERELLSLQDELPEDVARGVGVELSPEVRGSLTSGTTAIRTAFEAYLRGLGYLDRGDLEHAISSLKKASEEDHFYTAAFAALGEALRREHARENDAEFQAAALETCRKAIELDGRAAEAHESLGLLYMSRREYEQAIAEFQECLQRDPLSVEARAHLARAYEAAGRAAEAESAVRAGVKLRPACWSSHNALGAFLYAAGRHEEAKEEYLKALELAPEHPRVLNDLGLLFYSRDQYPEAARMLEKTLVKQPRAVAASNLATVYYDMGCYRNSVRLLRRAIELGEKSSRIFINLGEALLKVPEFQNQARGVFDNAVGLAKEELAADPTDVQVQSMLADSYARLGRHDEALAEIAPAQERAPTNVRVQFRAALVYEIVGRRERALEALGDALAAGYSKYKVCHSDDLKELRSDPKFEGLVKGGCEAEARPAADACPSGGPGD